MGTEAEPVNVARLMVIRSPARNAAPWTVMVSSGAKELGLLVMVAAGIGVAVAVGVGAAVAVGVDAAVAVRVGAIVAVGVITTVAVRLSSTVDAAVNAAAGCL
jgi:hypothetical protein